MAGYEWLKEELAVAVYYASEGVPHSVLVQILRQRHFFRTMVAIRNRLNTLRIQENLGGPWSRWDREAVDRWLDKLSEEVDVNGIIKPTDADQQIVNLHIKHALLPAYFIRRTRGNAECTTTRLTDALEVGMEEERLVSCDHGS